MTKRTIISQDYDGCYSIATKNGLNLELNGSNKKLYEDPRYKYAVENLRKVPDQYRAYLSDITKGADAVSVYVGSDRQSYRLDKFNASHNNNGSVFPALKTLCQERTTDGCPWTFEPYLLADTGHRRGDALSRIESNANNQLEAPDPIQFTEKGKPSKITLLMAQMWDAYKQYPEEQLEFHFVDDRQDLIEDIHKNLNPAQMPPGMTLKISKFDYIGVIQEETGSLGPVATIQSTRGASIDKQFGNTEVISKNKVSPNTVQSTKKSKFEQLDEPNVRILKKSVIEYLTHLSNKIEANGITYEGSDIRNFHKAIIPDNPSPYIEKLVTRYNAMIELHTEIKNKSVLNEGDLNDAKNKVLSCLKHKPDWTERPFLQKLTDVLTIGIKPLYRAFFSKEGALQEKLQKNIDDTRQLKM